MVSEHRKQSSSQLTRILAANVRAYRKLNNISQEELAAKCNLHRTYVGSVERGERNVTLRTLETMAAALDVSVPQLLTRRMFDDGS